MHVVLCVCICIYEYVYVCAYISVDAYVHVYSHMCIYMWMHMYMSMYMYTMMFMPRRGEWQAMQQQRPLPELTWDRGVGRSDVYVMNMLSMVQMHRQSGKVRGRASHHLLSPPKMHSAHCQPCGRSEVAPWLH